MKDLHDAARPQLPAGGEMMESKSGGTKVQALMGMALRSRQSEREGKRGRQKGRKTSSPIISLIPEIRFWGSIIPKIKGSLFHTDRDRSRRYIFMVKASFSLSRLVCPHSSISSNCSLLSDGISDRSFDSSLLCNTAAGKLHLCKCHTEWKEQAGGEPQALQGHANSLAPWVIVPGWGPKSFLMRLVKH